MCTLFLFRPNWGNETKTLAAQLAVIFFSFSILELMMKAFIFVRARVLSFVRTRSYIRTAHKNTACGKSAFKRENVQFQIANTVHAAKQATDSRLSKCNTLHSWFAFWTMWNRKNKTRTHMKRVEKLKFAVLMIVFQTFACKLWK